MARLGTLILTGRVAGRPINFIASVGVGRDQLDDVTAAESGARTEIEPSLRVETDGRTVLIHAQAIGKVAPAEVSVFDVRGRVVAKVPRISEAGTSGEVEYRWDRRDVGGREIPSGVYFVLMRQNHSVVQQKVVLLHHE
jgi:hypothetical protein